MKDETGFPWLAPESETSGARGRHQLRLRGRRNHRPAASISPRLSLLGRGQIALFQRRQPAFRASGIRSVCGSLKIFPSSQVAAQHVMCEGGWKRKPGQPVSLPCGLFIMSGGGALETYSAINMACAFCSWGSSRLLYRDGLGGDPMKPRKEPEDSQGRTTLLHQVTVKATFYTFP